MGKNTKCDINLGNNIFFFQLLLTVYYESQCPDSKTFILKQLQPALHLLHQYITLKLIPFGKSRVSFFY